MSDKYFIKKGVKSKKDNSRNCMSYRGRDFSFHEISNQFKMDDK